MNLNLTIDRSDLIGAWASGLCLIHCVATPLIFVAQASAVASHHDHHHHHDAPLWWAAFDIVFILISLVAVYYSAKNTTKNWIKYALFASWGALTFIILNEKLELVHLAEAWVYGPALGLILVHLYNRKYCNCAEEECCLDGGR